MLLATGLVAAQTLEPGSRDGEIRIGGDAGFLAWDAEGEAWRSPEAFWQAFADRRRGKAWPTSDRFPPYNDVNEHDTILLQVEQGPCLMYFFHTRWRRANDVWRWGKEFNEYGGCPHVFD